MPPVPTLFLFFLCCLSCSPGAAILEAASFPSRARSDPDFFPGPVITLPGAILSPWDRSLRLTGWFCLPRGYLEFLAVTPAGKTYESLLVLEVKPSDLTALLYLLDVVPFSPPGPAPRTGPPPPLPDPPERSQLTLHLSWSRPERPFLRAGTWTAPGGLPETVYPIPAEDRDRTPVTLLYHRESGRFWSRRTHERKPEEWGGPFPATVPTANADFEPAVLAAWEKLPTTERWAWRGAVRKESASPEELLRSEVPDDPLPPTCWTFTGSSFATLPGAAGAHFVADLTGSLVALYLGQMAGDAVICNFRHQIRTATSYTPYLVDEDKAPPAGTPVTLTITRNARKGPIAKSVLPAFEWATQQAVVLGRRGSSRWREGAKGP